METYSTNIKKEALENEYYRKVLFTGSKIQLVVMSLKPGEEIPEEVHHGIDQFIRIEKGEALARVDEEKFNLKDDDVIIIPAGKKHYIKNNSAENMLKIYTIYATPEHPSKTIHKTKAEADADEHHH